MKIIAIARSTMGTFAKKVVMIRGQNCYCCEVSCVLRGSPAKWVRSHRTVFDYGFPSRKIKTSYTCVDEVIVKREKPDPKWSTENEILRIFQALALSVCMLVLSYHSVLYGRTEFTMLESGQIVQGYVNKAVVTFSLGYSMPYSTVSVLAIGMLAYSLLWKDPRWSLPSIVLYLADLVYDVSGAIVAIWLFFSHFPFTTALSYTIGAILLIFTEIWIWMGVLRLYEQRTFK